MKHITLVAAMAVSMGAMAQITDGSFEAGIGAGTWTENSTAFGTPLCTFDACGDGGGTCAPRTGVVFAWFGGTGGAIAGSETGTLTQSVFFPEGTTAHVQVYAKIPATGDRTASNYLKVYVDGNEMGRITALDSAAYEDYTLWNVAVDDYADGAEHEVKIEGFEADAVPTFNVLADDIALEVDGQVVAGIFENEALSGVQVYPNPANNTINVNFNAMKGAAVVTITDINGQMVTSERFSEVSRRVLQYNATGLSNGLYMVTIEQAGQRFAQRVVVSH